MSKRDDLHLPVRAALEKEGWTITDDPLYLFFRGTSLLVDLGGERGLAAERDDRKIAVEIKGFESTSATSELEKTIGQLQLYRWALEEQEPDRDLFLAIDEEAHSLHFQKPLFKTVVERAKIKLIVIDREREEIVQWIQP